MDLALEGIKIIKNSKTIELSILQDKLMKGIHYFCFYTLHNSLFRTHSLTSP